MSNGYGDVVARAINSFPKVLSSSLGIHFTSKLFRFYISMPDILTNDRWVYLIPYLCDMQCKRTHVLFSI